MFYKRQIPIEDKWLNGFPKRKKLSCATGITFLGFQLETAPETLPCRMCRSESHPAELDSQPALNVRAIAKLWNTLEQNISSSVTNLRTREFKWFNQGYFADLLLCHLDGGWDAKIYVVHLQASSPVSFLLLPYRTFSPQKLVFLRSMTLGEIVRNVCYKILFKKCRFKLLRKRKTFTVPL